MVLIHRDHSTYGSVVPVSTSVCREALHVFTIGNLLIVSHAIVVGTI